MRKCLYLSIAVVCLPIAAFTQTAPTFSSSNTVTVGSLDSNWRAASTTSITSVAPAMNASWDFSNLSLDGKTYYNRHKSITPGATGSFSDTIFYTITPSISGRYGARVNRLQNSTGFANTSEEISVRQAFSLSGAGGGPNDSIVFPTQFTNFTAPLYLLKFPMTVGSTWTSTTQRNINFNLTVTAFSLNNASSVDKQTRTYRDSVVGWGRVKVPTPGGASGWMTVLQVQHMDIVVDSFFISGTPAPPALLTAFGVSQGGTSQYPRTYFYRSGEVYPVAEAWHSGSNFAFAPGEAYFHANRLAASSSVSGLSEENDVHVYPNPVKNGSLHVEVMAAKTEGWQYSLINISGQIVSKGSLPINSASKGADISLPKDIQAGTYYLSLAAPEGTFSVVPVTIE